MDETIQIKKNNSLLWGTIIILAELLTLAICAYFQADNKVLGGHNSGDWMASIGSIFSDTFDALYFGIIFFTLALLGIREAISGFKERTNLRLFFYQSNNIIFFSYSCRTYNLESEVEPTSCSVG